MVEDKEKVMNKRSDDILSLSCREIKFHIFFTNSKDKAYPIWIHFPSPNLVYYEEIFCLPWCQKLPSILM